MKTYKVVLLTLIVGVVLTVSARAGDHRGHGGSQDASAPAPAQAGGASSFRSGPGAVRFGGGRMIAPSQRFSSFRTRSTSLGSRSYVSSRSGLGSNRITPGAFNRRLGLAQFDNNRAHNFGTNRNSVRAGSLGRGRGGPAGVNNHVLARRSANWHRDWDRHHDHWWHGHRCHFVNGYWFIFDLGFSPWYGYPYDYYASYYYEPDLYAYDSGDYEGDVTYGGKDVYDSSDQNTDSGVDRERDGKGVYDSSTQGTDSPLAAAQERLSREGYYRGQIDGVFGPETRRAIMRYQSDKGLAPTGKLSAETMEALGIR